MKILLAILLLFAVLTVGPCVSNARGNTQNGKQITVAQLFHCHRHDDVDSDPPAQPLTDQAPREMDATLLIVAIGAILSSTVGLCAGIAKGYRQQHRHHRRHK